MICSQNFKSWEFARGKILVHAKYRVNERDVFDWNMLFWLFKENKEGIIFSTVTDVREGRISECVNQRWI